MAKRSELDTPASGNPAWGFLHRMTTPGLVYRLAGLRQPATIGDGRLAVRVDGPGLARLSYRNPEGEGRAECLRRQTWILGVPAACGASRATLRQEGCLAEGDVACQYAVTWTEDVRPMPSVLGGMAVAALALSSSARPTALWLLVPLVSAATYAVQRWRVGRAHPRARAQSRAAFRWLIARALAAAVSDPAELHAGTPPLRDHGVSIEPEGDVWRVAYRGTTVRLRHSRGLALLAHLIRSPGREIHVSALDAITPSGGSPVARGASSHDGGMGPAAGDAGEILDARARAEYRRRIVALREEREDATARADLARADAARAELERLEDELRQAVGVGGRARRAGSDTERVRNAISHRIRAAIAQIARRHPALGAHLTASVSMGYQCVYEPVEPPVVERRALEPKG
jgi:hypothetical protein